MGRERHRALSRPHKRADGSVQWKQVPVCICQDRRGPLGGVCGNCAGAIPEQRNLQER